MPRPSLDPAPRILQPFATLQGRSMRGPAVAAGVQRPEDVEAWLLDTALSQQSMLDLFEGFCWRLVAAGIPIDRAYLSAGTLHPQLIGLSWYWEASDGICDETRISPGVVDSQVFLESPLFRILETGVPLVCDLRDPASRQQFPVFEEIAAAGYTDYLAMPLSAGFGIDRNTMSLTMASRSAGALSPDRFPQVERLARLLAPHAARLMAMRIAEHIAFAYLGEAAGQQVLDGSIRRGAGAPVEAVILVADLRDFTELAGQLQPQGMLQLLNAYFDTFAGAIAEAGGEVLKFMGDGLLAVFPVTANHSREAAADQALAAARNALAGLRHLNTDPPPDLPQPKDGQPLRAGIALHAGEVFFGNVGTPDRLDFTVIGQAVNAAARVEALTKDLHHPLLITAPVARALTVPLDPVGRFPLRGVPEPMPLFAPSVTPESPTAPEPNGE